MEKKRRELIPGMRIKFEQPALHSFKAEYIYAKIQFISKDNKMLGVHCISDGYEGCEKTITRRQVVSVFVKKPKKEKLTVFVAKFKFGSSDSTLSY